MKEIDFMKLKHMLGLMALIGVIGGLACRAEETDAERLKRMDLNADGRVDDQELKEEVKRITFASVDANGDGALSADEWKAADRKPDAEKRFALIDVNKDGKIDPMEFSDFVDQDFAQKRWLEGMDADRSGFLTTDELNRKPSFNLFGVRF